LVIEAVFEDMAVKRKVLGEVEPFLADRAILATNTSSLSITDMSETLDHPERLVGLHFFNPVAVMPLIEIIKGGSTAQTANSTAFDLCRHFRKTGVLVKDSPAFLVNRILIRMLTDCMALVDKGAGFRQVDEAVLALGMPMGPFQLLGLVGPAVAYHASKTLNRAYGPDRFPLNENLGKIVEAGIRTFYDSSEPDGRILPAVEELWTKFWEGEFNAEQIRERVLAGLAREIALILEEKVVSSPKDVDLAMILGAGWPFFMGGITMYLDLHGISRKVLNRNLLLDRTERQESVE
jgi:3-hydroxyacyl-CoA dehydrogenase